MMSSGQTVIRRKIVTVVWLALAVFLLPALSGCAGPRQDMQDTAAVENRVTPKWEANGIEVVRIKQAANGMMLDLRYRVTDPVKAREMIKQTTQITLVDQATGTILPVPNMAKVGKLRNVPNSDNTKTIYWIFFNNPAGMVKPGAKVSLVIGNVTIKDIHVE